MSIYVDIEKKLGDFHLKAAFEAGNETMALLGASGCGKSVTLKCIAGIEKPDRGRIVLDGVTLFDSEKGIDLSPQKRHTGLLFQSYALFPDMTVLQNIRAGARREKDPQKRQDAVQRVLSAFALTALASHYPHQLSGGEQQRVALARILVSDPNILLLDEPFSALDSHLRFRLEQEVREVIRAFGKTVLLVSHDRDEVYRMADSIAVMENGRIEVCGEKQAVFAAPGTRAGAELTGCRNLSPIRRLGENRVLALDWGIELSVQDAPEDAKYVGIQMHRIRAGDGENAVACRVEEEIENPFSYTLRLRPGNCESTAPIFWETDKQTWETMRCGELTVCLPPESLLVLHDAPAGSEYIRKGSK